MLRTKGFDSKIQCRRVLYVPLPRNVECWLWNKFCEEVLSTQSTGLSILTIDAFMFIGDSVYPITWETHPQLNYLLSYRKLWCSSLEPKLQICHPEYWTNAWIVATKPKKNFLNDQTLLELQGNFHSINHWFQNLVVIKWIPRHDFHSEEKLGKLFKVTLFDSNKCGKFEVHFKGKIVDPFSFNLMKIHIKSSDICFHDFRYIFYSDITYVTLHGNFIK